ncbi:hypothetical protein [Streptomyces fragilis]|uniref:Peptidase M50 n=1 Tax=Streptomyces fragilis TaxID=67301 RepID=A0ABV2YCX8_9ACTN|nr:hypothetical protein [Streptomyces fragilis]
MYQEDSDPVDVTVVLRELRFRHDDGEWIVGCPDGGRVVAIPEVGMEALRLLAAGNGVRRTQRLVLGSTGRSVDVSAFVRGLADAGLVKRFGHEEFPGEAERVTLPRLRQRHVRWLLSPVVQATIMSVPLAGVGAVLLGYVQLPTWTDFLWSEYSTVNLLTQLGLAWVLIGLHELAHLGTARAAGVAGRVTLGTRLQFLVAQTEVSGIWLKGRRERLTVYLSGIALDACVAGLCLLALALGARSPLLAVVIVLQALAIAEQFMIFMRTDIYFLVQDLTGCRDLYGDAGRYLRHLVSRPAGNLSARALPALLPRERRIVMCYAVVAAAGTGVCLFLGTRYLTEVMWPLLGRSVLRLTETEERLLWWDSAATAVCLCGLHALWARTWWHRHQRRVRRTVSRLTGRRPLHS